MYIYIYKYIFIKLNRELLKCIECAGPPLFGVINTFTLFFEFAIIKKYMNPIKVLARVIVYYLVLDFSYISCNRRPFFLQIIGDDDL